MSTTSFTFNDALTRRVPTWHVAQEILRLDLGLDSKTLRAVENLAADGRYDYGMYDDFDRFDPADSQLDTLMSLFPYLELPGLDEGKEYESDPVALRALSQAALQSLVGNQFATSACSLVGFREIDIAASAAASKKALRKRLRFLVGFDDKVLRLQEMIFLRNAQMQAKSRLAYAIDPRTCDVATLAFCAYLASRANRRSLFMLGGQSKAQDVISDGLFAVLEKSPTTNWFAVALVKPTPSVMGRLSASEQGQLMGMFHEQMSIAASHLGGLWPALPERMRAEMVMVKGVDSSRWNAYAGALNTMRSAWINVVKTAGMEHILDGYCPGKAPRLMAADVVWWARNSGQELHEDTRMFALLPKAWDVINGTAVVSRQEILDAAATCKVDAEKTGWVGPRAAHEREIPTAEPALVHGVVVSDPSFARQLRKLGYFSGQQLQGQGHVDFVRQEVEDQEKRTVHVTDAASSRALGNVR